MLTTSCVWGGAPTYLVDTPWRRMAARTKSQRTLPAHAVWVFGRKAEMYFCVRLRSRLQLIVTMAKDEKKLSKKAAEADSPAKDKKEKNT